MDPHTESLYAAARKQLTDGNAKEAGRLVNEILAKDYLHSGAWEILYALLGKNEGLSKFQLDFTRQWYPQKTGMVEAFQRRSVGVPPGLSRSDMVPDRTVTPASPVTETQQPGQAWRRETHLAGEKARRGPEPAEAPTAPSREKLKTAAPGRQGRGSRTVTCVGLLAAVGLVAVCLIGGGLIIKKLPIDIPGLRAILGSESTPGAQEPVDLSSFFAPIDGDLTSGQQISLDRLAANSHTPATVRVRDGAVRFATMQMPIPDNVDADPVSRARYVLEQHRDLFQLREGIDLLDMHSVKTSDDQSVHVWFSQVVGDTPVYESKIGVHFNPQGEVILINGGYLANTAGLGKPVSVISAADAEKVAFEVLALDAIDWPEDVIGLGSELTIFAPSVVGDPGSPRFAWLLTLGNDSGATILEILVDIQTAEVLAIIPQFSAAFDLEIWDMGGGSYARQGNGQIVADETGTLPGVVPPVGTSELHQWSQEIHDFWWQAFGRDSWDGGGERIKILTNTHTGFGILGRCPRPNAFSFFDVEDGFIANSILICPYQDMYRINILAHEFTHGVTASEIELVHDGQAGALNEAFSDIFAELLEAYDPETNEFEQADWNYDMGGIGNRNLQDPTQSTPRQITHVGEMENNDCRSFFSTRDCKYIFSSIPGHVAYLLAEGGETNGVRVEAIGYHKTAQLYYRAIADGVANSNATFEDARDLLVQTCGMLHVSGPIFTSHDCNQVMNAWASVGVGDAAPEKPATPEPTQRPTAVTLTPTVPIPLATNTPALPSNSGRIIVVTYDALYSLDVRNGQAVHLADMPDKFDYQDILPLSSFSWVTGASPWSPDGKRILLVHAESGGDGTYTSELYVMNVDGSNPIRLATNAGGIGAWSPDGTRIAYLSSDETAQTLSLVIQASDGSGTPIQVGSDWRDNLIDALGWSPDGTKIAIVGNGLYVIDTNSLQVTQIATSPAIYPTWSSDSSRIAFCTLANEQAEIHTVNADGSNRSLIRNSACLPFWSPVSDQIAFLEFEDVLSDKWRDEQRVGLFVMQADGSEVRQIGEVLLSADTLEYDGQSAVPFWSPDGTQFVFIDWDTYEDVPYRLQLFDVNGAAPARIIDCPRDEEGYSLGCYYPRWVP